MTTVTGAAARPIEPTAGATPRADSYDEQAARPNGAPDPRVLSGRQLTDYHQGQRNVGRGSLETRSIWPPMRIVVLQPTPPRTVLVTGAAGYVGATVVARLLAAGRPVRALDALLFGDDALPAWPTVAAAGRPTLEFVAVDVRDAAACGRPRARRATPSSISPASSATRRARSTRR